MQEAANPCVSLTSMFLSLPPSLSKIKRKNTLRGGLTKVKKALWFPNNAEWYWTQIWRRGSRGRLPPLEYFQNEERERDKEREGGGGKEEGGVEAAQDENKPRDYMCWVSDAPKPAWGGRGWGPPVLSGSAPFRGLAILGPGEAKFQMSHREIWFQMPRPASPSRAMSLLTTPRPGNWSREPRLGPARLLSTTQVGAVDSCPLCTSQRTNY